MDIWQLIAIWLHTVAFVIAWGYYGILGRITMPALGRSLDLPEQARAVAAIERTALPLVLLSMALFIGTGTYLLFVDPKYEGLGNFFANSWTTLMLVKHLVVVVLIAAGAAAHLFVRQAASATGEAARAAALHRVRWAAEGATGLGAAIALLTVAAQLST